MALCEAGGREAASTPVVNPRHVTDGWLPLHAFVFQQADQLQKETSLSSPWADAFRLLLRLYPEAADTEAGGGYYCKTPHQLVCEFDLVPYYHRLLLPACTRGSGAASTGRHGG